jgi:hypothetical protein
MEHAMSAAVAAILGAIPSEVWAGIGSLLAGLIAAWVNGIRNRRKGRNETLDRIERRDHDEADLVRRELDSIDRDGSTIERLRRMGKWRG